MKRIFYLILGMCCIVGYASCDDGEMEYTQESSIRIISQDVVFPASASQGSIVVEAPGTVSVTTSDQGWCTTSVSGSTIQVNVDENPELDSRNSMLTIRCGADTTRIAVIQSGVIFSLSAGSTIVADDKAATHSYDVKCNTSLTLVPSVDWISAKLNMEEGKLDVTLKENNTGHMRQGNIDYKAGGYEGTILVSQCEFEKDIAGDYMLLFIDEDDGLRYYFNAVVKKNGIELPDLGFTIPAQIADGVVTVKGGQHVGQYENYEIYTTLWDTEEGYLTWNTAVSMSGTFQYLEEDGTGYTLAVIADDGSWGTYHPDAIRLEAFSSTTLGSSTRLGALVSLISPVLQRAHTGAAAVYRMVSASPNAPLKAKTDGLKPKSDASLKLK